MEKQDENDRVNFENKCETVRKFAVSMSSLTAENFDSEKLPVKERAGRISHDIKVVMEEIEALDRPEYYLYKNNNARLYELFKKRGILTNAEEMNKLQRIMILGETFIHLQGMAMIASLMDQPAGKKKDHNTLHREQDDIILHQVLAQLQKESHLMLDPSDIYYFSKIITCHDWSAIDFQVIFGCQTNEVKCVIDCFKSFNPDLTYANLDRCKCLISKSGKIITDHSLSTSKTEKLKNRLTIQKIIAAYKRKH